MCNPPPFGYLGITCPNVVELRQIIAWIETTLAALEAKRSQWLQEERIRALDQATNAWNAYRAMPWWKRWFSFKPIPVDPALLGTNSTLLRNYGNKSPHAKALVALKEALKAALETNMEFLIFTPEGAKDFVEIRRKLAEEEAQWIKGQRSTKPGPKPPND